MIARLYIISCCCFCFCWSAMLIVGAEITTTTTPPGGHQEESAEEIMMAINNQNETCLCCTDKCWMDGPTSLQCRDIHNLTDYPVDCAEMIDSLHISEGQFETLSEADLSSFIKSLKRLTIERSAIERLDKGFPKNLSELDVNNNEQLDYINWRDLAGFSTSLTRLNLAHNKLEYIDTILLDKLTAQGQLLRVDLSGNQWMCALNFRFALELHENGVLVGGEELTCQDETKRKDSWLKWNYSVIKREKNKQAVESECRERTAVCSCGFSSAGKEGRGSYTVQVDCSNRNLTTLPKRLPDFTEELDVSRNLLTSLDQVAHYGDKSTLRILIADSNHIGSIRNLSGSFFLRNFNRFSLRHNNIQPDQIPLKELAEVPSEFQVKYVYLYNNSWQCDCEMATKVRDWLWSNRHVVNDSSMLLCSRYGKKMPVVHLLPEAVCNDNWNGDDDGDIDDHLSNGRATDSSLRLLHAIIGIELFLIVALAAKFAYDSWRYVRHDQLPWIATKLF